MLYTRSCVPLMELIKYVLMDVPLEQDGGMKLKMSRFNVGNVLYFLDMGDLNNFGDMGGNHLCKSVLPCRNGTIDRVIRYQCQAMLGHDKYPSIALERCT